MSCGGGWDVALERAGATLHAAGEGAQMMEKVRKFSGETSLNVDGKEVVLVGQAPI